MELSIALTFSKSSMAQSYILLIFLAMPLLHIFLMLSLSVWRTWLAKEMTRCHFSILVQQRLRFEYAGWMISLIMLAISVLKSAIFMLFLMMYSKVITALENSFEAQRYFPSPMYFLPSWQASSAIFLCRTNSQKGLSLLSPSISGKSSSSSPPKDGSRVIVFLFYSPSIIFLLSQNNFQSEINHTKNRCFQNMIELFFLIDFGGVYRNYGLYFWFSIFLAVIEAIFRTFSCLKYMRDRAKA